MKKLSILCATDFSDSSMKAVKWAIDVAKRNGEKLIIMFCYRLIAAFDDEDTLDLKGKIEHVANEKFREFEREYLKDQPIEYSFIKEVGFYHFRIEMFLQRNPVGLVVLGNSIVQNFDEYKDLGFEKFLKNSKVPVVVVPQEPEATQIKLAV